MLEHGRRRGLHDGPVPNLASSSVLRRVQAGLAVAVVVGALTGCAAAATPAPGPTAGAAGGGLVVADPPHDVVQVFPQAGSCHARPVPGGVLPDPGCTPGAVDPHVTAATVDTTVCRPGGYTSTVRPPTRITDPEKRLSLSAYNNTDPARTTEFDHLVPLSLGGAPNSPANLWPEPGGSPNPKDKLEGALRDLLCAHRIALSDAQEMIATNWVAAYQQILGQNPPG